MNDQNDKTTSIPWGTLSATHPCYNAERIEKMKLLYKGGYDLKDEAKTFLTPLNQESGQSYEERVSTTALRPYLTKFVNIYKSNLFSTELTVHAQQDEKDKDTLGNDSTGDEFYKSFLSNCDGHRTSFHEFIKEKVYLPAEVCEYGYVGVDLPKSTQAPINRLQEEQLGLDKPYLYQIDSCSVWDWEIDPESGKFLWIKLGYRIVDRPNAFSPWMHYWKVCNFYMEDGFRNYQVFKTDLYDDDHEPKETDNITLVDFGKTSFKEIGIFCLDLSDGQSIGYMLGPMVEEDYQMTSLENAYTTKACLTIPWVKLKNNIAGLSNNNQKNRLADPRGQFNSKGFMALNAADGEGDSVGVVETEGSALKFLHLQSEDRKEQMHEIVNQLHSASKQTSSKTGRSAAAMKESRYQMEITLSDRASQVWKLAADIFTCISEMRDENILWVPKGLCTETPPDPQDLQKAAQTLSRYSIGSDLADKKIRFKIATGMLGKISGAEQEQVRREINDTVDENDNVALYGPMFDAQLQQQINAKVIPGQSPDGYGSSSTPVSSVGTSKSKLDQQTNIGDSGHQLDDPGQHLQSGDHIDPQIVYDQLSKDYDDKYIKFVLSIPWIGPRQVPTSSIDFSNMKNWEAINRPEKIKEFQDIMNENDAELKPIILVNEKSNNKKYVVLDGHTRSLAALQSSKDIIAYIGEVGKVTSEMKAMHSMQDEGEAGGNRVKSNQKETSQQK